jgi:hypothetical protein
MELFEPPTSTFPPRPKPTAALASAPAYVNGEVARPKARHGRKHVPGERNLLGDPDIDADFLDDGDLVVRRHTIDAQHASEIGRRTHDEADAGAAAFEDSDLTHCTGCAYRKSNPAILMVQSAQGRTADNASDCFGGA